MWLVKKLPLLSVLWHQQSLRRLTIPVCISRVVDITNSERQTLIFWQYCGCLAHSQYLWASSALLSCWSAIVLGVILYINDTNAVRVCKPGKEYFGSVRNSEMSRRSPCRSLEWEFLLWRFSGTAGYTPRHSTQLLRGSCRNFYGSFLGLSGIPDRNKRTSYSKSQPLNHQPAIWCSSRETRPSLNRFYSERVHNPPGQCATMGEGILGAAV